MSRVLPVVSLVVALAALGVALFRDPLGGGLGKYDFSTPRSALESRLKIEINKDLVAMMELEARQRGKHLKEKLDTIQVRKELDFQGKKILFVTFKVDGNAKNETQSIEKDAKTGLWFPTNLGYWEVEKSDKQLGEQMRQWMDGPGEPVGSK